MIINKRYDHLFRDIIKTLMIMAQRQFHANGEIEQLAIDSNHHSSRKSIFNPSQVFIANVPNVHIKKSKSNERIENFAMFEN